MPRFVYAALLLLSLIWGGSFYFIKMLLHDFGPWTIAFLRSLSGLVVVAIVMLALRKPFGFRGFPWLAVFVMAVINTALPWSLIGLSETRIASNMASILNATTPIWTALVGIAFFGQKSGKLQWFGIAIATVGTVVLTGVSPDNAISVDAVGFIAMLGATLYYGVGSQLSKRLLNGYTMFQITFGTLLGCALASGSVSVAFETPHWAALLSWQSIAMIVGLGVFGTGIAFILFYYIVQEGSAEFATMVTYLVPCTALIWGYTLLDEAVHWNMLAGLAVILAGVYLAGRRSAPSVDGGGQ